jgi:uncharacterized RDD family membrane protein YckC
MDTTYKIIAGDGAEYGPVTLPELKAWIVDGRIAGSTQVWRSDQARWRAASQYEELYPEIGQIEKQTPLSPDGQAAVRYVGFWARVGAYLLDNLVMYLIFLLAWGPEMLNPGHVDTLEQMLTAMKPASDRFLWIHLVYFVILNGQFGATLGKMAIRAKIVNLDGGRIGFGRALLRWFGSLLNGMTLGLGFVVVAFRADKRGLHDLLAGTKVVYRQ